mmetsp:Transcript_17827/g.35895  ORF Transcript_17827/g.35895 Transcript_17827/m.35895 type:complete len:245 (-) Transcript_17827:121-855(-)
MVRISSVWMLLLALAGQSVQAFGTTVGFTSLHRPVKSHRAAPLLRMSSTSSNTDQACPAFVARLHFAARKQIKHQRFELARHIYETAVEFSGGQHGRTFLLWALLEQRCGEFDRARSVFRQALEYHPHSDQVAMAWGLLESKRGLPQRAKLLLERAAALNPSRNTAVKRWKRLQPIFKEEQRRVATPKWADDSLMGHLCSGHNEDSRERREWVAAEAARLEKQQELEAQRIEAAQVRRMYSGSE